MVKLHLKRPDLKAVATVEMAYIMPVVLLSFMAIVYSAFYYHDKNVLMGMAYETAVLGTQKERTPKGFDSGELAGHFTEHVEGKLILFSFSSVTMDKNARYIVVKSEASKRHMRIQIEQRASITEPEKFIRLIRKVER